MNKIGTGSSRALRTELIGGGGGAVELDMRMRMMMMVPSRPTATCNCRLGMRASRQLGNRQVILVCRIPAPHLHHSQIFIPS